MKDGFLIIHPEFKRETYIDQLLEHCEKQEQQEKLNSFVTESPSARERLSFKGISIR